jgi:DNA-binding HxlR family transcriptional regulator
MDERSIFFEVWVRDFALAQENGDTGIPGNCPLDRVLRLLWHEWTTHILWVLGSNGPTRFGELQRRIRGISPKVLSQRLRQMEAHGLVCREPETTVPPKVTYSLTKKGIDIHTVLCGLQMFADRWADGEGA